MLPPRRGKRDNIGPLDSGGRPFGDSAKNVVCGRSESRFYYRFVIGRHRKHGVIMHDSEGQQCLIVRWPDPADDSTDAPSSSLCLWLYLQRFSIVLHLGLAYRYLMMQYACFHQKHPIVWRQKACLSGSAELVYNQRYTAAPSGVWFLSFNSLMRCWSRFASPAPWSL